MKRIVAVILAVTYLVYTTGMQWDLQESWGYSYAQNLDKFHTSSLDQGSGETSSDTCSDGIELGKIVKHLATAGKIKMPRTNATSSTYKDFSSFKNASYDIRSVAVTTPAVYGTSIFLKNCVLII